MTDSTNEATTQVEDLSTPDRIKQLNDIDKDIVKLLHAAGTAVTALTPSTNDKNTPTTQETREAALLTPSKEYLSLLDSIRTRVRRQIMALEEAGIISVDSTSRAAAPATQSTLNLGTSQATSEKTGTIAGGQLGNLDVSWLNARNSQVGDKKAADIRREAEAFLSHASREEDSTKETENMDTT